MAPAAAVSPPQRNPPLDMTNGVFQNGAWHCKCGLIARKKTVRTNSKNYGRCFYKCRTDRDEGNWCDFFLWVDDAERRERAVFLSNGRSEKRQATLLESITPRKGKTKGKQGAGRSSDLPVVVAGSAHTAAASKPDLVASPRDSERVPAAAGGLTVKEGGETSSRPGNHQLTTSDEEEEDDEEEISSPTRSHAARHNNLQPSAMAKTPTTSAASFKRKRPLLEEQDLLDELSSGGEEELVAMSEISSKQYSAFTTPTAPRTADIKDGMPTPSLTQGRSTKKVLFKGVEGGEGGEGGTSGAKRQRLEGETPSHAARLFGTNAVIDAAAASSSPTPQTPFHTTPDLNPDNLTKEVMELLKDANLTKSVRGAVRTVLERYAAQAKGYERGRDTARKAAKEAEERAGRLQAKIDALESSRQELRTQLMDTWSKL
ncbi:hypothetical protein F4861DRAFT_523377 [Xylaria intraflava]|nr:hypothetical protein F4861DRAFT_523377 [Xylaria intraflava]